MDRRTVIDLINNYEQVDQEEQEYLHRPIAFLVTQEHQIEARMKRYKVLIRNTQSMIRNRSTIVGLCGGGPANTSRWMSPVTRRQFELEMERFKRAIQHFKLKYANLRLIKLKIQAYQLEQENRNVPAIEVAAGGSAGRTADNVNGGGESSKFWSLLCQAASELYTGISNWLINSINRLFQQPQQVQM